MSSKTADSTIRKTAHKKAVYDLPNIWKYLTVVRHVPSRYMQAAQVSKSSSAGSTSVNTTTSLNSNETLDFSQAGWTQGDNSSKRFASTPNSSDSGFSIPPPDASLIAGSTAHHAPVLKEHLITASALKQRPKFLTEPENIRPSQAPVPVAPVSKPGKEKSTGAKSCVPDRAQEIETKNMYAIHMQAAFLESRARKSFQICTQNALEQFYNVYCVIQILMQKLTSVESVLLVVSHLQLIQQLLKPQDEALEVVLKDMPALLECYCEISKAIDFVRSNLPLSDIHIATDSNLRADLSCQLAKCEAQLESFFKSHLPEMTESSNLSKLLLKIKNCVEDLGKETHKLNDLLLAVDEMAVTESSLKIGEIMSTVVNNCTT